MALTRAHAPGFQRARTGLVHGARDWNKLGQGGACLVEPQVALRDLHESGGAVGRIEKAVSSLNQLETELERTKQRVQENSAIVSPLRSLPPEVLEEIFSFALPPPGERIGRQSFTREAPWSLTQVCRRWRLIAQSFPPLWTTISIHSAGDSFPLPALRKQISLSGNRPLLIRFISAITLEPCSALLMLLARHSDRWELADLRIAKPEQAEILRRVRGGLGVPLLRSLRVDACSLNKEIYGCFDVAPNLRHLTISNPLPSLALPWSQLVSLDVTGSALIILRLLKRTTNIRECRLRPFACQEVSRLQPQPARLPHLQKLYVQDAQILDYLVLPSLKELFLPHDCVRSAVALVHRSSCSPEKLFTFEGHTPRAVGQILKECPSITTLGMQVAWDDAAALSRLLQQLRPTGTGTGTGACLAPNLTALSFAGCIDAHDAVLADMLDTVAARRCVPKQNGPCRQLEFLGLFMPEAETWLTERLDVFRARGLRVHIATGPDAHWTNARVPDVLSHWSDPAAAFGD
ncbi:hypothetical protein GGX14DRAFT_393316 [Mycena pura]|uniref:F-box domain-containing protein n=1 Tax=Mycena pura TaxID=153505 RepID=A0AAD6VIN5_9AGAR|nr:hypothetical protein GGX14DRAFT_393316 [Mycena pura]